MSISIRRLGAGDERALEFLAVEAADFGLADRGAAPTPLGAAAAGRYLANPAVLHWVAVDDHEIVGDLACILLPLRSGGGQELLVYDIGVRASWRGRGVGRALLAHMESWMRENGVGEVWVLSDPDAMEFYRACGFDAEDPQPVYMTRRVTVTPSGATAR